MPLVRSVTPPESFYLLLRATLPTLLRTSHRLSRGLQSNIPKYRNILISTHLFLKTNQTLPRFFPSSIKSPSKILRLFLTLYFALYVWGVVTPRHTSVKISDARYVLERQAGAVSWTPVAREGCASRCSRIHKQYRPTGKKSNTKSKEK